MNIENGYTPQFLRIVAAGIALGAISAVVTQSHGDPESVAKPYIVAHPLERLRSELARCRSLSADGVNDPACRSAWAENRRRFFSSSKVREDSNKPIDVFPSTVTPSDRPARPVTRQSEAE